MKESTRLKSPSASMATRSRRDRPMHITEKPRKLASVSTTVLTLLHDLTLRKCSLDLMWPVLRPERQLDRKFAKKKETSDAGFEPAREEPMRLTLASLPLV